MNSRLFHFLRFLFFLSVGLLIVWLVMRQMTEAEYAEIRKSFTEVNYFWIVIIIIIDFICNLSRAVRWVILMEPLGKKTRLWTTFSAVMIGHVTNLAIPRIGEVIRCSVIKKYEGLPVSKTLGTVIAERVIDVLSLLFLMLIVVLTQFHLLSSYVTDKIIVPLGINQSDFGSGFLVLISTGLLLLCLITGYVLIKYFSSNFVVRKIKMLLQGFWEGLQTFKHVKQYGWFWFHTLIIWITNIALIIAGFKAFEATFDLGILPAIVVLVFSTIGLIIIQGGIGIVPVLIMEILELYGLSRTVGFALGWILWAASTFSILFLGFLSFISLPFLKSHQSKKSIEPDITKK